jgi:hypothetical protein
MATQETWKKRISAWRSSGRSAEDFAIGRGFTAAALHDAARRAEPEVRLARVELVAERVPDGWGVGLAQVPTTGCVS